MRHAATTVVVAALVLGGCSALEELQSPTDTADVAQTPLAGDVVLYEDALGEGWSDWSWAKVRLGSTAEVFSGSRSISVRFRPWTGLYLHHAGVSTNGLTDLRLWLNPGSNANPTLVAYVYVNGAEQTKVPLAGHCTGGQLPANAWTQCRVPLAAMNAAGVTVEGVVLQEYAGRTLSTLFVDSLALIAGSAPVISISPEATTLTPGGTQQFTATVTGTTNVGVTWSVQEGAAGGSITAGGLYTAPSTAGTFHVVATSQADPTRFAVATVTVTSPPAVQVTVSPQSVSLSAGATQQFAATVSGTSNTAVTWSVQEGAAGGSITAGGLYTAPSTAGTFHVVATSQADPTRSGFATVNVTTTPPPGDSGIPPERTTRWDPGIPGGVPERTTICATISATTYGNDSTDARGAIQSALNACPDNQVVYLPPGTYRLSGTLVISRPVVLRGAGANQTTLRASGVGVRIGNFMSFEAPVDLTADAPKGTRTLTVANSAPFDVGDVVHLDQLDDRSIVQGETCEYFKRGSSGAWRSIGQRVEITAKSGNTLTLGGPLHWTFRTSLRAQLVPMLHATTRFAGVENLRVINATNQAISIQNAAYSWVKGVETSAADGDHINLAGAYRCVVRDSYAHHSHHYSYGGNSYGYTLEWQTSDTLIENNIVRYMNKPIQFRASGGGNVLGYNYVDDSWSQPDSEGKFWYQEMSIDMHCAFPHMELVEGNYAPHIGGMSTWGNGANVTYFRNQATSVFATIVLDSPHGPGNQAAIGLDARMLGMNVVGNVLSAPNIGARYETTDPSTCTIQAPFVYRLNADSANGYCSFPSPVDTQTSTTLLRHGNFDYVTNAVQWSPSISTRSLPASLYLPSKPAFFGANPWPWVDATSPTPVGTLPAKARYDAGRPNG